MQQEQMAKEQNQKLQLKRIYDIALNATRLLSGSSMTEEQHHAWGQVVNLLDRSASLLGDNDD